MHIKSLDHPTNVSDEAGEHHEDASSEASSQPIITKFYDVETAAHPLAPGSAGSPLNVWINQLNFSNVTGKPNNAVYYKYAVDIFVMRCRKGKSPTSELAKGMAARYKRNCQIGGNDQNKNEYDDICRAEADCGQSARNAEQGMRVLNNLDRREIFYTLVANDPRNFFGDPKALAYDGQNTLITPAALNGGMFCTSADRHEFYVCYKSSRDIRPRLYRVLMSYQWNDTINLLPSYQDSMMNSQLHILATIGTNASKNPFLADCEKWLDGRVSSLHKELTESIGDPYTRLFKGVRSSVVSTNRGLTMAVDATMSPVAVGGDRLLDRIMNIFKQQYGSCTIQELLDPNITKPMHWAELADNFKNLLVRQDPVSAEQGIGLGNQVFVAFGSNADTYMFNCNNDENAEPKMVTVAQYFRERYSYTIKYPRLPTVVIARSKALADKKIKDKQLNDLCHIPLELISVDGPRRLKNEELQPQMLQQIIRKAAMPPAERRTLTQQIALRFLHEGQLFEKFGIRIDLNFAKAGARILPAPVIFMSKPSQSESKPIERVEVNDRPMGSFKIPAGIQLKTTPSIETVFCIELAGRYPLMKDTFEKLRSISRALGMQWKPTGPTGHLCSLRRDPNNPMCDQMGNFLNQNLCSLTEAQKKSALVLVIVPQQIPTLYYTLKHYCDNKFGIASQVILAKNAEKMISGNNTPMNQTAFNILLKINVKMGGVNWIVGPVPNSKTSGWHRVVGRAQPGPYLIMSIDINVPQPKAETLFLTPTIITVVANEDTSCSNFVSENLFYKRVNISSVDIGSIVKERIEHYITKTKCQPAGVILIVDMHNAGEIATIADMQCRALHEKIDRLYTETKPEILYMTQNKMHANRLYVANAQDGAGRHGNVPAGTVVDSKVVDNNEFLLCSHGGIQGTSKPSKVRVHVNETSLSLDEIENIMHSLAYNWQRSNKAISTAAPLRFAKTITERKSQQIAKVPVEHSGYAPKFGPQVETPFAAYTKQNGDRRKSGSNSNGSNGSSGDHSDERNGKKKPDSESPAGNFSMTWEETKTLQKSQVDPTCINVAIEAMKNQLLNVNESMLNGDEKAALQNALSAHKEVRRAFRQLFAIHGLTDFQGTMRIYHAKLRKINSYDEHLNEAIVYQKEMFQRNVEFGNMMGEYDVEFERIPVINDPATNKPNFTSLADIHDLGKRYIEKIDAKIDVAAKKLMAIDQLLKNDGIEFDQLAAIVAHDERLLSFATKLNGMYARMPRTSYPDSEEEFDDDEEEEYEKENEVKKAVQQNHAIILSGLVNREKAKKMFDRHYRNKEFANKTIQLTKAAVRAVSDITVQDTRALSKQDRDGLDQIKQNYREATKNLAERQPRGSDSNSWMKVQRDAVDQINQFMEKTHTPLTAYLAYIEAQEAAKQAKEKPVRGAMYNRLRQVEARTHHKKLKGEKHVNISTAEQFKTNSVLRDRLYCL